MKTIEFTAEGHRNIRATHTTTFEFTKSKELSLEGDCIIAVNADFELAEIKKLMRECNKIKITISADGISDEIEAEVNKRFDCNEELVIRIGQFDSVRTLGIRASKAAVHLSRELIDKLHEHGQKATIKIEQLVEQM